jgi:hypothetical protein
VVTEDVGPTLDRFHRLCYIGAATPKWGTKRRFVAIGFEGRSMANYMQTADVLARWREVERRLEEVQEGTPEAEDLQAQAAALREEMRRLTESSPEAAPAT